MGSDEEVQVTSDGKISKMVKLYRINNPYAYNGEDEDGEINIVEEEGKEEDSNIEESDEEEGEYELEEDEEQKDEEDQDEMEFEEIKASNKKNKEQEFDQIKPKKKLERKFVPYESESTENTPRTNSVNSSASSSQIDEEDAKMIGSSIEMVDLKKPSVTSEMREFKPSGLVNHSKKKREKRKAKKEAEQ